MLQITPSFYEKTYRQELARARFLCDESKLPQFTYR